ncbi:MAG: FHA domain-containing protein [Patescibacteria group bacterium]
MSYVWGTCHRPLSSNAAKRQDAEQVLTAFGRNPNGSMLWAATPSDMITPYSMQGRVSGGRVHEFKTETLYFMDSQKRFYQNHAYSIESVNPNEKTVTIVNPHDTGAKRHTLKYQEFFDYFGSIESTKLNVSKIQERYGNVAFLSDSAVDAASKSVPAYQDATLHVGQYYKYPGSDTIRVSLPDALESLDIRFRNGKAIVSFGSNELKSLRPGETFTMGRSIDPTLSQSVSRDHLEIRYGENGNIYLRNIGGNTSTARTYKNLASNPSPAIL